jgi:ketosteroid isomerase-like protein
VSGFAFVTWQNVRNVDPRRYQINTETATRDVARGYLDAWTRGDLDAVRRLLASDVTVECNAGLPADPEALAQAVDTMTLISETYAGTRAVLLYDCVIREPAGTVRTVEFLEIVDSRIREIRRIYDLMALRHLLPSLARTPPDYS